MEDRPYTANQVLADTWRYYADKGDPDFADRVAVDHYRLAALVDPGLPPRCDGSDADREYPHADVDQSRVGTALDRPPGLGGPREFAVSGAQLIALMEHVAAVRRLARRGWVL